KLTAAVVAGRARAPARSVHGDELGPGEALEHRRLVGVAVILGPRRHGLAALQAVADEQAAGRRVGAPLAGLDALEAPDDPVVRLIGDDDVVVLRRLGD